MIGVIERSLRVTANHWLLDRQAFDIENGQLLGLNLGRDCVGGDEGNAEIGR